MDMLPVPHSDELRPSTNGDSGLKPLERQVERGQLFAHTALGESFTRLGETEVFLHGLLDLLLAKGIVNEDEYRGSSLTNNESTANGNAHEWFGKCFKVDTTYPS